MNVLVTGGAGFIGSHAVERLLQLGHTVRVIDDLNDFYSPELKRENLALARRLGPVEFHQCDICDQPEVFRVFDEFRPEAVIHLAARAGVRPSLENPLLYEKVNVGGTIVLLEAARRHGVRKFVFASSSSVYGIADQVPFSEDNTGQYPISPYAATKIAGEKLCYTYSHLYALSVVCLRFFTVYGPRQRPDLAIRKFVQKIDQNEPIQMFGDGSSGRDYTHIDDILQGVTAALELTTQYDVINLGNSHPISLAELIRTIEAALGKKASIRQMPMQAGDVPITCADISKARRLLGYAPQVSFPEGIREFAEWYLDQKRAHLMA